jgi:hypothetical protein
MSSIIQLYNLHYWETEVSHLCLKNGKFTAFILWTHSQCGYTNKLRVSHKSFPSAHQLLWNFTTYEAASARNLLSIFPYSITLSKSWLPTFMQASHILKVFLVTQQSPNLVIAVIFVQKLTLLMQEVACSIFSILQCMKLFLWICMSHCIQHSWLQGNVKELNQCHVGLLPQNGTSSGRHSPNFFLGGGGGLSLGLCIIYVWF